jgi:hypothetical protein
MSLVVDAGPILSFTRAQRLELLRDVVSMLLIPEAVYDDMVNEGRENQALRRCKHRPGSGANAFRIDP